VSEIQLIKIDSSMDHKNVQQKMSSAVASEEPTGITLPPSH
jgi:hypothetical protein